MVDITLSIHGNACFFKANTRKGEKWLGSPEVAMPLTDAKAFQEAAHLAGLIVKTSQVVPSPP